MAEQLRRLDYERRSKYNSLLKSTSRSQNIKKECSSQVRAANEMEDRKKNLYILRTELHKRNFLERHEYEVKVVQRFRNDLDVKSQKFTEKKFQQLRAISAGPRLQSDNPTVLAMVPKKYYEDLSDDSDEEGFGTSNWNNTRIAITSDNTSQKNKQSGVNLLNFTSLRAVLQFKSNKWNSSASTNRPRTSSFTNSKQNRVSESQRFLHPKEFERLREEQMNDTSSNPDTSQNRAKTAPAAFRRRSFGLSRLQSDPSTVAYIPRDVRSAPPNGRTGDASGMSQRTVSRSYRILKEAFKKTRKEIPNPSKDRFNKVKKDHEKRVTLLNQRIMRRFDDIFEEEIFRPVDYLI